MATYTWDGYTALIGRLDRISHPDPVPLLVEWEQIIAEDNRRGILAGVDCFDRPQPAVTYRPIRRTKKTWDQQNRSRRGIFAGLGPHPAGTNNNLTSAEYRKLGGPPLAPRGIHSRVITNLFTRNDWDGEQGKAVGAWAEVVSTEGKFFLHAHFTGANNLPVRDLRGVRAWGRQQAVDALHRWATGLLGGKAI